MTQKEFGKLLGISGAMVSRLAKLGMPTDSLEKAQNWRRRHLQASRMKGARLFGTAPAPASASGEAGSARDESENKLRRRRELAAAERAEYEVAELVGRLVTAESVRTRAAQAGFAIIAALEPIADRASAECGADDGQRRKIRQALEREFDRLRDEVAKTLLEQQKLQ